MAQGDHYFTMYLNRTLFLSIPHTLEYENQTMMVVVEGKKPQCWNCKQVEHFHRTCSQKTTKLISSTLTTTTATTAIQTTVTISPEEDPKPETGDNSYKEEGLSQVIRGGKKKSPLKTQNPKPTQEKQQNKTPTATITTIASTTAVKEKSSSSATRTVQQKKEKAQQETMDIAYKLKRRRDSKESLAEEGEKNIIKNIPKTIPATKRNSIWVTFTLTATNQGKEKQNKNITAAISSIHSSHTTTTRKYPNPSH